MKPLKDFLKEERLILHCGGTGPELIKRGGVVPGALSCLLYPDLVRDIQREYVEVGATLIQACTFGMNPIYAKMHIPDYDWKRSIDGASPWQRSPPVVRLMYWPTSVPQG